jgi:hypothetical protein
MEMPVSARMANSCGYVFTYAVARQGPSPSAMTATNRLRRLNESVSAPTSSAMGAPSTKNATAMSPAQACESARQSATRAKRLAK